jgi:hypothetical protein
MALRKSNDVSVSPLLPWQDDPFDRRIHGERLLSLIRTLSDQPYVIALNGDWGTGKSVFLRRLEMHFQSASPSIPFVRIDAWISDDAEDPLVPFVAALHDRIRATQTGLQRTRDEFVKAAAKLAVPVTSFLANAIAPGSGGLIDAASEAGQSMIDWQIARTSAASEFREALAKVRDGLTERESNRPISRPIVIAIDELDRCRPDFSIKALERIKHFFNVPGVVFLIATDSGNLPAAVRSVYGDAIDGELYLRKFFDYEYRLPRPTARQNLAALWRDFDMERVLPESNNRPKIERAFLYTDGYSALLVGSPEEIDAFEYQQYFAHFSELFDLSLRDQAQAFTMLSAHVRTTPRNYVRLPLVDSFMVCLRFFYPAAFEMAKRGTLNISANSAETPEKARKAFNKIVASPDGRALSKYLTEGSLQALLEQWNSEIRRLFQQGNNENAFAYQRMAIRCELNKNEPLDYIDGLLGLIFSFSPDVEEADS